LCLLDRQGAVYLQATVRIALSETRNADRVLAAWTGMCSSLTGEIGSHREKQHNRPFSRWTGGEMVRLLRARHAEFRFGDTRETLYNMGAARLL